MGQNDEILRVTFRSGMVDELSGISKCPTVTFISPDIPTDILTQMREDDYGSLKVRYGDPSWGDPIQYDYLEVETTAGIKSLEIFNRAILLLTKNTEETRRAHRIIYCMEKHIQSGQPQK